MIFKDLMDVGNLYLDRILFQHDVPVLFTCKDQRGGLYLCLCSEIRGRQKWIISRIYASDLRRLIIDKISIYDALKSTAGDKYIVEKQIGSKDQNSKRMAFSSINRLDLPEKDLMLDLDIEEMCVLLRDL